MKMLQGFLNTISEVGEIYFLVRNESESMISYFLPKYLYNLRVYCNFAALAVRDESPPTCMGVTKSLCFVSV